MKYLLDADVLSELRKKHGDSRVKARAHGLVVVTRNVADFQRDGIEIVDPWNR